MKHLSYPKIPQFRNVIRDICISTSYVGKDELGTPVYDESLPKPVLKFTGTVKLHGTNAAVCHNMTDGLWVQSRKNIITPIKDNAGFAFFVENSKDSIYRIIHDLRTSQNISNDETVSIYGEWAGGNIQKNVGLQNLPKSFYIFGVKVTNGDYGKWLGNDVVKSIKSVECELIFNIFDFPTFEVIVDFNNPQFVQNQFVEFTNFIEKECPVCKQLGVEKGLGEGLVWSTYYNDQVYRFKTKGEKHSASNVKTLASVDTEKLESIAGFVKYACTENRLHQGVAEVYGTESVLIGPKFGELMRWMIKDITEEESDVMFDSGLEPKEVNKSISQKVKELFSLYY